MSPPRRARAGRGRRRLTTWALALVAGAAVTAAAASPAAADDAPLAPDRVPGPVVLVGTGGVRWSDTGPATPALNRLLAEGAVGVESARSVRASTCPVDGWLGVSAGARAADEPGPAGEAGACRVPATTGTPGSSAQVDRWPVYSRLAAASPGDARPGLLGSTLASAGVPVAAVGPGAAIALADATGSVPHAWPGVPAAADGGIDTTAHSPDAAGAALATQVRQALATSPGLLRRRRRRGARAG